MDPTPPDPGDPSASGGKGADGARPATAAIEAPRPRLSWAERGTRSSNRLRVSIARALLRADEPEKRPVIEEALAFLGRVVSGEEDARVETRVQAAAALSRAGASMARAGSTTNVDARRLVVNVTQPKDDPRLTDSVHQDAIDAYLNALAAGRARADGAERVERAVVAGPASDPS